MPFPDRPGQTTSFPGAAAYLNDIQNTYSQPSTFLNGAYDDESWWALAWLNAYKLAGNSNYLQLAESLFYNINQNGWDSTCNRSRRAGNYNSGAEGAWAWLMNTGMVETVSTSPTTLKLVADHLVGGASTATAGRRTARPGLRGPRRRWAAAR